MSKMSTFKMHWCHPTWHYEQNASLASHHRTVTVLLLSFNNISWQ